MYNMLSFDIKWYNFISFDIICSACIRMWKASKIWIIILITESKWLNPNEGLYTPKSCRLATWVALAVNMMHQEGASDLSGRGMMILAASLPHPTTPAGPSGVKCQATGRSNTNPPWGSSTRCSRVNVDAREANVGQNNDTSEPHRIRPSGGSTHLGPSVISEAKDPKSPRCPWKDPKCSTSWGEGKQLGNRSWLLASSC